MSCSCSLCKISALDEKATPLLYWKSTRKTRDKQFLLVRYTKDTDQTAPAHIKYKANTDAIKLLRQTKTLTQLSQ